MVTQVEGRSNAEGVLQGSVPAPPAVGPTAAAKAAKLPQRPDGPVGPFARQVLLGRSEAGVAITQEQWCRKAGLDAIIIASPNFTHIDILRDTMQTDLAHLVEKPMCTTMEDALEIEERVKSFDPVFWVGLEYRYMPPVARMIERAHAGDVGAMKMLSIREHRFPFLPKVGNWNRFNKNSGGTFVEKCCHFFDLMRFILQEEPVAVMGMGGQAVNHLNEAYDGETPDIFDHGFVAVEFESGAKAQLDLCMFAEGSENQEEITLVGDQAKLEVKIPEGVITFMPRRPKNPVKETVEIDEAVLAAGSHFGSSYFQHLD